MLMGVIIIALNEFTQAMYVMNVAAGACIYMHASGNLQLLIARPLIPNALHG